MHTISKKTDYIKNIAKLQEKKHRDSQGVFVIEGLISIKEAIKSDAKIQTVALSQSFCLSNSDFVEELLAKFECKLIDDVVFKIISDTVNSQGIVAVVAKPKAESDDLRVLKDRHKRCIYLDRVRDPGNLGAILRTAVSAGFDLVFLDNCVDVFNAKVVRSAASALFGMTTQTNQDISKIKEFYQIICADLLGDNFFETKIDRQNICLVIGNESVGISDQILGHADLRVALPMKNIQSLNAAVAAGILMYNIAFAKLSD